jgi:hypothetical protein
MRKWIAVSLAAGFLAISPSALVAQSSTNSTTNSGQTTTTKPDAAKKAEQHRQIMAILGITKADLKGLTPEERAAKIKTATDNKIAELEKKQAAGTLTEKEQSDLALLKKSQHHGHAKAKTDS